MLLFLNITWGFLQTLIGFFVFLRYIKRPRYWYKGCVVVYVRGKNTYWGGISLGAFIFIDENITKERAESSKFLNHEHGHALQSAFLGPLYLLIVGLPSLLWPQVFYLRSNRMDYSSFYTERWADKWGLRGDEV